jgi:hypothetical protein
VAHGESGGERREAAGPWLPKRARTWRLLLRLEHRRCSRGDDGHAAAACPVLRGRLTPTCARQMQRRAKNRGTPGRTNPCSGRWSPGIRGRRRRRLGPPLPVDGNSPVRGAGSRYQHPGTRPPDAGQRRSSQGTPCLAPSHPSSISIQLPEVVSPKSIDPLFRFLPHALEQPD